MVPPLLLFSLVASAAPAQPPGGPRQARPALSVPKGGALAGQRPRVIVSSDIGGSDPDDFQSMVHLLLYADVLDIEGLVSSPPGKGRAEHILETLAAYEKDYPNLVKHSSGYPKPDALRALARQGAVNPAPQAGFSEPTDGSEWIIECAKAKDPQGRPLWVLVWGSITDVAQAAHDEPAIKRAVRVHSIGSWNTAQDRTSRDYLFREHPDLWWIESDTTFRGMYVGGQQEGDLGNRSFIAQHVKGHGALGDFYLRKKADIKMGDTPSLFYLFRGDPHDPTAEHWGGAFVRPEPDKRPTYWHDNPDPALADQGKRGAKTVSKWRADYLRDWQQRMERVLPPSREKGPAMSGSAGGWRRHEGSPVLGGKLGTCFDISVLRDGDKFRMWFSWRPKASLALAESADGLTWSEPKVVLGPNPDTSWEKDINRPSVLKRGDTYHMWYTGQASGRSWIGYATSKDGAAWTRMSKDPVLSAEPGWEKGIAVMCPHVLWDDAAQQYRMWYSGGEQYEPNAIGYATSPDGLKWTKRPGNPIFQADPKSAWEKHKVTGGQIIREGDWHVMLYIGFADEHLAQIGLARSRDGLTGWERHPANPIVFPVKGAWDGDACYKPYAIFHDGRWLLWYNGRKDNVEQIGVAIHDGRELWPAAAAPAILPPDALKP